MDLCHSLCQNPCKHCNYSTFSALSRLNQGFDSPRRYQL
nr:MAG TPA: protein of unknown function (DUF5522) [Caudoviricetes sp.]